MEKNPLPPPINRLVSCSEYHTVPASQLNNRIDEKVRGQWQCDMPLCDDYRCVPIPRPGQYSHNNHVGFMWDVLHPGTFCGQGGREDEGK
jgi:hypothetical protein